MKKDPHKALGVVKEVIENALECNKNSEEFKEAVIDANMLLQESLYHLSEHAHFITAPRTKEAASLEDVENKERIISLAKQVGLMDKQIDDVFKHIGIDTIEKDGETTNYYSVDKAVPIIMDMEKKCSSLDDATSQDMSTNFAANPNTVAATAEAERKRLELLGLRIRSVFEDGCEYEGTISDVHYRVTYDDQETETMTEVEAFKNLTSNFSGLAVDDKFRCKALELFSGCSLLSTFCRRKGMSAISVEYVTQSYIILFSLPHFSLF